MARFEKIPPKNKLGPNGNRVCKLCDNESPTLLSYYCSDFCRDDYFCRTDKYAAKKIVYRRDHGVCQSCSIDFGKIEEYMKMLKLKKRQKWGVWFKGLMRRGFNPSQPLWLPVHIKPLENGGDDSLANFKTMCVICHKKELNDESKREDEGYRRNSKLDLATANRVDVSNDGRTLKRKSKPFFSIMPTKISI